MSLIFLITYLVSPLDLDNNEMNRERGGDTRKRIKDSKRSIKPWLDLQFLISLMYNNNKENIYF